MPEVINLQSTKNCLGDYENELTVKMDSFVKHPCKYFDNYICKRKTITNHWVLRYPGATRGHIEVDDNNIIQNIKIYDDTDFVYNEGIREALNGYIGCKLIFEE